MKRILIILISLFIFFACNKESDEINKYLTLNGEQEKIDLVNGIYSRLVRVHNKNYFRMCCRSDDVNIYDIYQFSTEHGACSSWGTYVAPLSGTVIGEIYVNLYAAIINANNLIFELSVADNSHILGEVYFLRAYCFFKLARFFGQPPLVKDVKVSYTLEKPAFEEVYQLIEEDLLNAIDLLPVSYNESRIPGETPHVGTAKALLAEVYLTMGGFPLFDESKYAEAARVAKEVMDNAAEYNFELIPDIAGLRLKSDEHCNEYIFTLFNKSEINVTNGTINNSTIIYTAGFAFEDFIITNQYSPEIKFFADFPQNYRKNMFLKTGEYHSADLITPDSTSEFLNYNLYSTKDPCIIADDVIYLKYFKLYDWEEGEGEFSQVDENDHYNLYLLRYAQTLLTYAEAKARSGGLDQSAFEAVNMIRRRANKLDLNTPSEFDLPGNLSNEEFIDTVIWERAWELCFEPDGRWFDLIRLDMHARISEIRYAYDFPSVVPPELLTEEWYFYKIPQEDRWINPNFDE